MPRSAGKSESVLLQVVLEVVAFVLHSQKTFAHPVAVNSELRPDRSFYEILQDGGSSESRANKYCTIVQDIVTRRRGMLDAAGLAPSVSTEGSDGRVLATDLSSTMYDGVAGELTGGYFDHADAPPPATWLGVRRESKESPGYNGRVYLLSWIAQADVGRVNVGIDSTPSGCLSWVEDWRGITLGS